MHVRCLMHELDDASLGQTELYRRCHCEPDTHDVRSLIAAMCLPVGTQVEPPGLVEHPQHAKTDHRVLRQKVSEMMTTVFRPAETAVDSGKALECAIYEDCGGDDDFNKTRYKQLFVCLKINLTRNRELCEALDQGALSFADLVRMRPEDMLSKPNAARIAKLKKRAWEDAQVAHIPMDETDQFQCGRCKKKRCIYFQKQTRCADEPMTTFVQCRECLKTWRC